MTNRHPAEADLALLAGGDCGSWQRFRLNRHVSGCGDCKDILVSFGELRSAVREMELPQVVSNEADWSRIAGEMRANIRLGLAAGECVADAPAVIPERSRFAMGIGLPRFAMGMAGVIVLAGVGLFLRGLLPPGDLPGTVHDAVVESTGKGVQLRTDSGSMTLLNHGVEAGDQTVTSQGAVRASYVDGNTGTVTITSVYVE